MADNFIEDFMGELNNNNLNNSSNHYTLQNNNTQLEWMPQENFRLQQQQLTPIHPHYSNQNQLLQQQQQQQQQQSNFFSYQVQINEENTFNHQQNELLPILLANDSKMMPQNINLATNVFDMAQNNVNSVNISQFQSNHIAPSNANLNFNPPNTKRVRKNLKDILKSESINPMDNIYNLNLQYAASDEQTNKRVRARSINSIINSSRKVGNSLNIDNNNALSARTESVVSNYDNNFRMNQIAEIPHVIADANNQHLILDQNIVRCKKIISFLLFGWFL